jgi:hypothetical protein
MGFRFVGIATSDKFSKDNIDEFSIRFFTKKLSFVGEVILEESMQVTTSDDFIDILFLDTGTLIFGSSIGATAKLNVKGNSFRNKAADFAVDETSMNFIVNYYENLEQKINLFEFDGRRHEQKSEDFNIEYSDGFDLTTTLIQTVTGKGFNELQPDLKLYRYTFIEGTPNFTDSDRLWLTMYTMRTKDPAMMHSLNKKEDEKVAEKRKLSTNSTKKWWKFWK